MLLLYLLLLLTAAMLSNGKQDYYYDGYNDDYFYEEEYDYEIERDSGNGGSVNPLAALIAPLAALALLGAATAVALNPVLVQLAVVNNGRRKRSISNDKDLQTYRELSILEGFLSKQPGQQESQSEVLLANYVDCTGLSEPGNLCLDYLTCIYSNTHDTITNVTKINDSERSVLSIVLYNIMKNKYIDFKLKSNLQKTAQYGKHGGNCDIYTCNSLIN